ncbi:hypothetical protein HMPREF9318_01474 [Streptococcus urinalis FB127-CNA-2]|uniref:CoiA-like protein n=1 Tax=Streptococcus urinalis 2285-97 TaxID=764291 RepID=G5KDL0_9STRE|nr:CoiA-like protein [Streptococcus urinalis 2285-97]EKS19398.1 hypothetical protein HMPREF9318_01474 [Streptococcus urinalis FB127-CNA-2]VEF31529.1 competence CoiA-like family protein [Streptococcus urinalis]
MINHKLILEVQCSHLSLERLLERQKGYNKEKYHTIWLLDRKLWLKNTLSQLQKQFLNFSKWLGFYCYEADIENNEIRLKYMIHEDIRGRVHYLTKSCSLTDNIYLLFRYPFMIGNILSLKIKISANMRQYIQQQLYFKNPKWLKKQEEAYLKGYNILLDCDKSYYPQVFPPHSKLDFCLIDQKLGEYYDKFKKFYCKEESKKQIQIVYSPCFYVKIK